MGHPGNAKRIALPTAVAARYGLALASVAVAFGLADTFLRFDLPQPFTAVKRFKGGRPVYRRADTVT